MAPWLSQEEVDDLCKPLKQAAAQIRYMRALGLTVRTKPNGAPVVMRVNVDLVLGDNVTSTPAKPAERVGPNRGALVEMFKNGRSAKGAKTATN
ncbi:MAG: DUF4224 domain-containing protein [Rhodocyclales bacterium]|nr:DUF4224 domain-containing protein [Rhodocyclales bacterium]